MEVNRLESLSKDVFQRRTSNGSVNKGDGLYYEVTKGTPTCSWLRSTLNIFRPVQYCFLGDFSLEMINGALKGIRQRIYFPRIAEVNVFYYPMGSYGGFNALVILYRNKSWIQHDSVIYQCEDTFVSYLFMDYHNQCWQGIGTTSVSL